MNPPPLPNPGLAQAKTIARSTLKRFGPLLLTGLAAIVEHHWLKEPNDQLSSSPVGTSKDENGDSTVQELKSEVKKLRRKLRRKRKSRDDSSSPSSSNLSEEIIEDVYKESKRVLRGEAVRGRGRSRPWGEEQPQPPSQPQSQIQTPDANNERYYHEFETWGPTANLPPVPDPPSPQQQYQRSAPPFIPAPPFSFPEPEVPLSQDKDFSRRRRHQSLHSFVSHERAVLSQGKKRYHHAKEPDSQAVHASQVATVAGIIEAVHVEVEDEKGHWYGRKGLRVGTTVAASFGASLSRGKNSDHVTVLQSAMDVGKGLAVSRMVHGRLGATNGNKGEREGDVRRWSLRF